MQPRPCDLGLPARFTTWRKGQWEAFRKVAHSPARYTLLITPTGSGKSVTYTSVCGLHEERRTAILTATRALQDQLVDEFADMGLVDIRGRDNYVCNIETSRTAGNAKCCSGVYCPRVKGLEGPCDFYDQKRDAMDSLRVNSNYAFWLHDEESRSLGDFSQLILDEAHKAPEEIERFAAVELSVRELQEYGLQAPPSDPSKRRKWQVAAIDTVGEAIRPKTNKAVFGARLEYVRRGRNLIKKLSRLCRLEAQEWLFSRRGDRWRWDLLKPSILAEELLFRGAGKVVLASATINRKTLRLLGVHTSNNVRIIEQDSTFPVANRPIYYWPVARIGRGMEAYEMQRVFAAIDTIIETRTEDGQGRRGIIHCVSYDLGAEIVRRSRLPESMFVLDTRKRRTADVVEEFRRRKGSCVLVSPAVTEGLNFPGAEAEFQIIPKMPFPSFGDALVVAKKQRDSEYIPYVTLQTVVQAGGRVNRSESDRAETWILDAHFGWLKSAFREFVPRWFSVAIKTLPARIRREDLPALLKKVA